MQECCILKLKLIKHKLLIMKMRRWLIEYSYNHASALKSGVEKSTNDNTAPLKDRIEKFIGFVSEEIEPGQIFDMVYEQGKGSVLYKNGVEKGYVEGLDFKKALFNIW